MPKKYDPLPPQKKEKMECQRSITQKIKRKSIKKGVHNYLCNISVIPMDPIIFDLATDMNQADGFLLPTELHFSHLFK